MNKSKPFLHNCPAPAKLNLFLHVTGQRPDGYHLLQSVFQLIDLCDTLHFDCRDDSQIRRLTDNNLIPEEDDLVIRAARLLQKAASIKNPGFSYGVDIRIEKSIPMGGGLGGGSSDAATTLLVLNRIWNCDFTKEELMSLSVQLGADVPFFIFGENAYAEGIGEKLSPVATPDGYFVVVKPPVSVPTVAIFRAKELTRNTEPIKMADFPGIYKNLPDFGKNDLQPVAIKLYPEIAMALDVLGRYGKARMTGSGACVFARFGNETEAEEVAAHLSEKWEVWTAKSLQNHPLEALFGSKS